MCDYKVGISAGALVIMDIQGRELLRDNHPSQTWDNLSQVIDCGTCVLGNNIEIQYRNLSLVCCVRNGQHTSTTYIDFDGRKSALEFAAKVGRAMIKLSAKK